MRFSNLARFAVCVLVLLVLGAAGGEGGKALAQEADSSVVLRGTVTDARTGETLPSATVQVEGSYVGTITNRNGRYTLEVDRLPVALQVRYIGYATATRRIEPGDPTRQSFALQPEAVDMSEVVVTGEDFADNVMRKVIERKQAWWDSLDTYRVDAYNRFTVRNDTGIVSIIETRTEAFWDDDRGTREIQRARRQTANMNIADALPAALLVENLYRDDVEVGGHTLYGVTHPDALDQYDFALDSVRVRDGQRVYDIRVEPAGRLKSAFTGTIAVLDSAYAMIEADLRPGRSFLFPQPVRGFDVRFQQQFSSFGGRFWLPVDFRASYGLKIQFGPLLEIPELRAEQVSRLTNYAVNVPVPDSLFEDGRSVVTEAPDTARSAPMDPRTAGRDSLNLSGAVPLSDAEKRAYDSIDSTATLQKAFEPTGPAARLLNFSFSAGSDDGAAPEVRDTVSTGGVSFGTSFGPVVRYNRVDGLRAGAAPGVSVGALDLKARASYGTAAPEPYRVNYGASLSARPGSRVELRAAYRYGTARTYRADLYGQILPSLFALAGETDYYDYAGRESVRGGVEVNLREIDTDLAVEARSERFASVQRQTGYDLLGRSNSFPQNPPVEEGFVRSLYAEVEWGGQISPVAVTGQKQVRVAVEHSRPEWVASEARFTRLVGTATVRVPTFFQRRILPNTLDVRLHGQAAFGDLPSVRYGTVNAALLPYAPFGALRTLDERPYRGEHVAAAFWEHSFRTVPFEILGLDGIAQRGLNVIVHGAHARTWQDDALAPGPAGFLRTTGDAWHHEVGLGVSGLLGLLRADVSARLDRQAFSIGISAARIF